MESEKMMQKREKVGLLVEWDVKYSKETKK
jgi:hypothetical protein